MKNWHMDEVATRCDCGRSSPELRYNPPNNGIAWQCASCNAVLSQWLPHDQMRGLNLLALPRYDRAPKCPGQGSLL